MSIECIIAKMTNLGTELLFDSLVKSQNLKLPPQLVGIVKVVNMPYIVVTKISLDFLRNHHYLNPKNNFDTLLF